MDANPDPHKGNLRQRPLLTVDEVVTPQMGNCTIFARYVEPAFATQVILTARLTRLYEREDWAARFAAAPPEEPLLLERGVAITPKPISAPVLPDKPQESTQSTFEQAAIRAMERAQAMDKRTGGKETQFTNLREMRRRREAAKGEIDVAGQE